MDKKYAVFRVQKIKSRAEMRGKLKHNVRESVPVNARVEDTSKNIVLYGPTTSKQALKIWSDKLAGTGKVRKNAVQAIEFVITGSKEKLESMVETERNNYFRDSVNYLGKLLGEDNIISAAIHKDEISDHLHVLAIPITKEGKLAYNQLLGGHRDRLSKLQTDFYEKVAVKHGLDRGKSRSERTKATDLSDFYSVVNKTVKIDNDSKKRTFESQKAYYERVVNPLLAINKKHENYMFRRDMEMEEVYDMARNFDKKAKDSESRLEQVNNKYKKTKEILNALQTATPEKLHELAEVRRERLNSKNKDISKSISDDRVYER